VKRTSPKCKKAPYGKLGCLDNSLFFGASTEVAHEHYLTGKS
jgi:hypothetical protein